MSSAKQAPSSAEIHVYGQILPAAICPKCQMRVYPAQGLKTHRLEHDPERERFKRDHWGARRSMRKWEEGW